MSPKTAFNILDFIELFAAEDHEWRTMANEVEPKYADPPHNDIYLIKV